MTIAVAQPQYKSIRIMCSLTKELPFGWFYQGRQRVEASGDKPLEDNILVLFIQFISSEKISNDYKTLNKLNLIEEKMWRSDFGQL